MKGNSKPADRATLRESRRTRRMTAQTALTAMIAGSLGAFAWHALGPHPAGSANVATALPTVLAITAVAAVFAVTTLFAVHPTRDEPHVAEPTVARGASRSDVGSAAAERFFRNVVPENDPDWFRSLARIHSVCGDREAAHLAADMTARLSALSSALDAAAADFGHLDNSGLRPMCAAAAICVVNAADAMRSSSHDGMPSAVLTASLAAYRLEQISHALADI